VTVKAAHLAELRACVDVLRVQVGLMAVTWSDLALQAGETWIRAVHDNRLGPSREHRRHDDRARVRPGLRRTMFPNKSLTLDLTKCAPRIVRRLMFGRILGGQPQPLDVI
jgi:hypothetical protein